MLFLTFFGVKTNREKNFFICLVFLAKTFRNFFSSRIWENRGFFEKCFLSLLANLLRAFPPPPLFCVFVENLIISLF